MTHAISNNATVNLIHQTTFDLNRNPYSLKTIQPITCQIGSTVSDKPAESIAILLEDAEPITIPSSLEYEGVNASQDATSAYAKAAAFTALNIPGLEVIALTRGTYAVGPIGGALGNSYTLIINNINVFFNTDVSSKLTYTQLRDAINSVSRQTGVIASLNETKMSLTARDGRNIQVIESGEGFIKGQHGLTINNSPFANFVRGKLTFKANFTFTLMGNVEDIGCARNHIKEKPLF